jgi:hypothetical protein
MTRDEVLTVLDELILSHKSSWGRMSDYPLVRATQDEALAAVAALYEERDALRDALKQCAAVCSGETLSKHALVSALCAAKAVLPPIPEADK